MQATKKNAPDILPPAETAGKLHRRAKDAALIDIAQLIENSQVLAQKTQCPTYNVPYDMDCNMGCDMRTQQIEARIRSNDPRQRPIDAEALNPKIPEPDGLAVHTAVKDQSPPAMFVILSGSGETDSERDIFRLDADDFSLQPCELNELLVHAGCSFEKQDLLRQLARQNRLLEEEVLRHERTETDLEYASDELEQRLEERTAELQETHVALNVLLKKREADQKTLEGYVMANIDRLVEPVLTRLEESRLTDQQQVLVDILRSNLKELTSPFADTFSTKLARLTPAEIQIANLVKMGKRTKEIAKILHLSAGTISIHRKNIRKKLNLTHQKTNLQSLLTSGS